MIFFSKNLVAHHVVDMRVGVEQHQRLQAIFINIIKNLLVFVRLQIACVDDDTLLVFIVDDVGVYLYWIEYECLN